MPLSQQRIILSPSPLNLPGDPSPPACHFPFSLVDIVDLHSFVNYTDVCLAIQNHLMKGEKEGNEEMAPLAPYFSNKFLSSV